jgi:hypothetical protein
MRQSRGIEKPKKDQLSSARAILGSGVFFWGVKLPFFARQTV